MDRPGFRWQRVENVRMFWFWLAMGERQDPLILNVLRERAMRTSNVTRPLILGTNVSNSRVSASSAQPGSC